MFEGFERGTRRVGEVDIHYVMAGSGPPVLMLHGFPQNLALWARVAPRLAERYTVVCADLRGYGDSSKPEPAADLHNYSFRAMAQDQAGLMRALGFPRFHLIGHDRGGRTGYRMALDHPEAVRSLAVLDIAPTYAMYAYVDHQVAAAYWHWYFLQQPAPYPERIIEAGPDPFYEGCLAGWGATALEHFDPEQLAAYRRTWRDPGSIRGSCADYRAAARVDFAMDARDDHRRLACPVLAFWGSEGVIQHHFDLAALWGHRCERLKTATLPGGHFFIDQRPAETADVLAGFLADPAGE